MNRWIKQKQQKGAALVVAMILLLLLTLLGTDAMRTSMLDMHLSKGFQDQNYAFQSAETGLRLAEEILQSARTPDEAGILLSGANINFETTVVDYHSSSYWQDISNVSDDHEHPVKVVVQLWRFVADSLEIGAGDPTGMQYYRVTARSSDPGYQNYLDDGNGEDYKKARSLVVLQSVYAVRHTNF